MLQVPGVEPGFKGYTASLVGSNLVGKNSIQSVPLYVAVAITESLSFKYVSGI